MSAPNSSNPSSAVFKCPGISFINTEVANSGLAGSVNGTEVKDEFVITGTQSVSVNGIFFNQVINVDANGNTNAGELDTVSGSNTWNILSACFESIDISFINT